MDIYQACQSHYTNKLITIDLSHFRVSIHYLQKKALGLLSNLLDIKTTNSWDNTWVKQLLPWGIMCSELKGYMFQSQQGQKNCWLAHLWRLRIVSDNAHSCSYSCATNRPIRLQIKGCNHINTAGIIDRVDLVYAYLQRAVTVEAIILSFVSPNIVYLSRTKFSNPDCEYHQLHVLPHIS